MPSPQELIDQTQSVRTQCNNLLDAKGELLPALAGKDGLLNVFLGCIDLMKRTKENYATEQKLSLLRNATASAEIVAAKSANIRFTGVQDQQTIQDNLAAEFRSKWEGQLQQRILGVMAKSASGLIGRWQASMTNIEAIVARLQLSMSEPTSLKGGEDLETLLARTHLQFDLEQLDIEQLASLFWAERRLNPDRFEKMLPIVRAIAKTRASADFAQRETRKRAQPGRTNYYTDLASKAAALLIQINSVLSSRVPADLQTWTDSLQPQIQGLTKLIIGIDAREMSAADFAKLSASWKPDTPLSQSLINPMWPLRLALPQVNPTVRPTLMANISVRRPT